MGLCDKIIYALKLSNISVVGYNETVANPTSNNVEDALKLYKENHCQGLIAFGGGSAMDCAKAVGERVVRPNKSL
ncbi:MAG: iron-containing alcohol dehydrogenase [Christensenellales bacterium]